MIDRIFQTVKALLNTDGRGNFSPADFDNILHNVVTEKYEHLFFEVNRLLNKQNRGLVSDVIENTSDKVREKIQHYITPYTTLTYASSSFALPADLRYFDTVLYTTIPIDICKSNAQFEAAKIMGSLEYPIGLKQGTNFSVYPTTITTNVTMSYLRNPLKGKWTYNIVDEVEIFNLSAGDYQDVDIHPGEEDDVIIKVLQKFGMNLKEQDVQQMTQQEEALEFQQENKI